MRTNEKLTQIMLKAGIAVPILYFGIQVLAARFYPGYGFTNQDASALGSNGSSFPDIFNKGLSSWAW